MFLAPPTTMFLTLMLAVLPPTLLSFFLLLPHRMPMSLPPLTALTALATARSISTLFILKCTHFWFFFYNLFHTVVIKTNLEDKSKLKMDTITAISISLFPIYIVLFYILYLCSTSRSNRISHYKTTYSAIV